MPRISSGLVERCRSEHLLTHPVIVSRALFPGTSGTGFWLIFPDSDIPCDFPVWCWPHHLFVLLVHHSQLEPQNEKLSGLQILLTAFLLTLLALAKLIARAYHTDEEVSESFHHFDDTVGVFVTF